MSGLHDVYLVFGVYPSTQGELEKRYAGKFWRTKQRMAVLEDHRGFLSDLPAEAPLSPAVVRQLDSLSMSGYLRVVPMQPSKQAPGAETMSDKDEDLTLAKTLARLRSLVESGLFPPEDLAALEQGLLCDEIVPSLRNLRAYRDHLGTAPPSGVYLELDFDFPGAVGDPHGHRAAADEAERAAGALVRSAVDDVLGSEHRDAWHVAGLLFVVFTTTHELGTALALEIEGRVARLPPLSRGKLALNHRVLDAKVSAAPGGVHG